VIEMMIIAAIVAKVGLDSAGKFAVDVGFGVRGKASPRLTQARARRTPGAASRYFSELWDDAWSDASKKRAARRQGQASSSRPRGAATSFWANWLQDGRRAAGQSWERGWVRLDEKRREKATRPRPGQVTVPGTVVPNVQDETEDGPVFRPGPEPHVVPTEDGRTDLRFGDDPDDPTGVSSCPECGGTSITEDGICLSCRDRQEQRNQHWDEQDEPDSVPDYVPDFDPSPATPTTEGPTTMTTTMPTGEVTSLSQTIRFCEDSAQAYRAQVHAIEQTQATLAAEEVSGPAAAAFSSAMEQSHAAAASMEVAAGEFRKHLVVLEAYDAVQGAGTKQFVTGGR
jgi:hypothetical protein